MSSPAISGTSAIDRFFRISDRGSTVGREVRGGLVTFVTMAYIVVLNPLILGFAPDSTATSSAAARNPAAGWRPSRPVRRSLPAY